MKPTRKNLNEDQLSLTRYSLRIIDFNPIVGFVDYGTIECDASNIYSGLGTKMRCKKCGHAWLSENEIAGIDTCPKCFATDKDVIMWKL